MKKILLSLVLSLFVACGGGSGGDEPFNFIGVWDAKISLTDDVCDVLDEDERGDLTDVLTINQMGSEVEVTGEDGVVYRGETEGSDGFVVTADAQLNKRCSGKANLRFNSAKDDTAAVSFVFDVTCGGVLQCRIEYSEGSAQRRKN